MNTLRSWFSNNNSNNNGSNRNNYNSRVQSLQQMGFDSEMVMNALAAADGDVDVALEILLSSSSERGTVVESSASAPLARSAASVKAGQAALQRAENRNGTDRRRGKKKVNATIDVSKRKTGFENLTSQTTANVKLPSSSASTNLNGNVPNHLSTNLPSKISDKSLEEQVTRCVERVAPYPRTVETFLLTFTKLKNNPDNDIYRKLDSSNAGFERVITGVPGAEDLLRAVKFHKRKDSVFWVMQRVDFDPALMWMAVSALEEAKLSKEYNDARKILLFETEVGKILEDRCELSEMETIQRAEYISQIPTEPSEGQGALVQLVIGRKSFSRRFDGDDQLKDILNWIGGHSTLIRSKILSREWCVLDLNRYPSTPIAFDKDIEKTLQFIGFWPSGKLELRPSEASWFEEGKASHEMGEARGLGAALL